MRFKASKTSLIITGGVVAIAITITVLIVLFTGGPGKNNITGVKSDKSGVGGGVSAVNTENSKIKESLNREKELMLKDGKYIGRAEAMAGQKNPPSVISPIAIANKKEDAENLKKLEAEIFTPVVIDEKPKTDNLQTNKEKQPKLEQGWVGENESENDGAREAKVARRATEQKAEESRISKIRKQKDDVWTKIYTGNASGKGGFIAASAKSTEGESQAGSYAGYGGGSDMPHLKFLEPYTAVIEHGFTSGSKKIPFIAKCTQPGSIYGWKIMGSAMANMETNRFDVVISKLLSPEGKSHSISGYAASIDDSDGVVTAVKHDEIPGLIISSTLAAASDFFKGLKQDSSSTVISLGGITTTPNLATNRLMEAQKTGLSTIFNETKAQIAPGIKKTPTLIVLKNTPILLYFNPQESAASRPAPGIQSGQGGQERDPDTFSTEQSHQAPQPLSRAFRGEKP